ncbi:FABP family protein [Amnibacterium endophyticum]|uniref:Peroxynitrite isomerase n=1 Tax=Amnibacterium endophyticum TaxID=2109337 RepID=A0ABW4LDZ9_9MICO
MIDIPAGLPAELVPLSWLIGVWEGTGLIEYEVGDETRRHEFGQRVSFSHDGLPYLNYSSFTWLFGADRGTPDASGRADEPALRQAQDDETTPLVTEAGYWRISRPPTEGDPGPGMLPGTGPRPFSTAASVETLRNASDGFDVEVSVVHPTGVSELYLGRVKGPRVDLATDAVLRTESAKEYSAATRLYGLVEGDLLWAWDIAALGQELRTHSSGRLRRVD